MIETIERYETKLARKERAIERLQQKDNNFDYEMTPAETIQLNVLQAEVRLLNEFIEDLRGC